MSIKTHPVKQTRADALSILYLLYLCVSKSCAIIIAMVITGSTTIPHSGESKVEKLCHPKHEPDVFGCDRF
jgi:hypothetical protein